MLHCTHFLVKFKRKISVQVSVQVRLAQNKCVDERAVDIYKIICYDKYGRLTQQEERSMMTRFWNALGVLALVLGMALPQAPMAEAAGDGLPNLQTSYSWRSDKSGPVLGEMVSFYAGVSMPGVTRIEIHLEHMAYGGYVRIPCNFTKHCMFSFPLQAGTWMFYAAAHYPHEIQISEVQIIKVEAPRTGTISGSVRDLALGLPVEVFYEISRSDGTRYAYGRTQNGVFDAENLPPGRYYVTISTTQYISFLQNPQDVTSRRMSSRTGNLYNMWLLVELPEGQDITANFWLFASAHDPNVTPPP